MNQRTEALCTLFDLFTFAIFRVAILVAILKYIVS